MVPGDHSGPRESLGVWVLHPRISGFMAPPPRLVSGEGHRLERRGVPGAQLGSLSTLRSSRKRPECVFPGSVSALRRSI